MLFMNILKFLILQLFILVLISCGSSSNTKSRKILHNGLVYKSSKTIFDPASLKFNCDSLNFVAINSTAKIQKLIINNGSRPIDTLEIASKNFAPGTEKEIQKADLNFDGFCEFVIPDKKTTKNGGTKHYYFMYDIDKRQFVENTSLPAFISSLKLDIKNQRVKLYCPGEDCFAYYKYSVQKKFELVQGEFK